MTAKNIALNLPVRKANQPFNSRVSKKSKKIPFWETHRFQNITGSFLILLSLCLGIFLISFLFTGVTDYSEIINSDINIPSNGFENWGGALGAYVAHYLMYNGFGLMSFLFIPLFFSAGFKILFKKDILIRFSYLSQMITFFVLWGAVTAGFIVYFFNLSGRSHFLSGAIGLWSAESLFQYIGYGTPILLLFALIVFSVFYFGLNLSKLFTFNSTKAEEEVVGNYPVEITSQTSNDTLFYEIDANSPKINGAEKSEQNGSSDTEHDKKSKSAQKNEEEKGKDVKLEINENENGKPESEIEMNADLPEEEKKRDHEEADIELLIEDNNGNGKEALKIKSGPLANKEFYDPSLDLSSYKYPELELLNEPNEEKSEINIIELEANKNKIVETLANYDIEIAKIKATIGPTVTLYEIVPSAGVRISKIKNLEDDIALSLSALGIRIIAPMPGKGTIGIEVPNSKREIVMMRAVLAAEKFATTEMDLPVALGKTIANEVFIADLAKMPHLLMAGATGQGKSAGLNAILTSLIYKKHPSQLKFVLVDPKKVELSNYKKIEKHFLAKLPDSEEAIITDVKQVVHTLNSLCLEMDLRYDLLKEAGCRNLKEYNYKFISRKLNPNDGHRYLPYIILVVDELADLMLTAGKEVETPICRLAQLARAIGIHLIVATQRPSVNVITGLIKANFPVRLSYKVTAKVDSRTILDVGGADQLVGQGDLLLSINSNIFRLQGAFIDTPEVDKLCEYVLSQPSYSSAYLLPEAPDDPLGGSEKDGEEDAGERDSFFEEAARILVRHQQGSTSLLQRRLKLGYNRAGRLIDQLEKAGIVGPFEGSKAREVLIQDEYSLERFLNEPKS